MNRSFKLICLLAGGLGLAGLSAGAAGEKFLSKEEALKQLTAVTSVKSRIDHFISWTAGYDVNNVNRVKLVPAFLALRATPKRIPPDGRTVLEITAAINDPGGLANISGVRADLTNIGRFSNMSLVDNGLFGDKKAGDGIFTLQANVDPRIALGEKEVPVTAVNRKGWLAMAKANIDVEKNPRILKFQADQARYAPGSTVILTLQLDNPGNLRDIQKVLVDLSFLGLGRLFPMQKIDNGIYSFELVVPASSPPGAKRIPVLITNAIGGQAQGEVLFEVVP